MMPHPTGDGSKRVTATSNTALLTSHEAVVDTVAAATEEGYITANAMQPSKESRVSDVGDAVREWLAAVTRDSPATGSGDNMSGGVSGWWRHMTTRIEDSSTPSTVIIHVVTDVNMGDGDEVTWSQFLYNNMTGISPGPTTAGPGNSTDAPGMTAAHSLLLLLLLPILITLCLNLIICLAIRSDRRLAHHMTYYFLVSMAVLHIAMTTVLMPATLAVVFSGDFHYNEEVCKLWVTLDLFFCNNTCLHLAFTSMDMYLRLRDPPRHSSVATTTCSLVLWLGAPWSISLMQAIAQFMLSQEDHGIINKGICFIADKNFLMLGTLFSFFIPVLISVGFYGLIAHEVRVARRGRYLDDSEQGSLHNQERYGSQESVMDEGGGLSDSTSCGSDADEERAPREDVPLSVVNQHERVSPPTEAYTPAHCDPSKHLQQTTSFCQEQTNTQVPTCQPNGNNGNVNLAFSNHLLQSADQTASSCSLLLKDSRSCRAKPPPPRVLESESRLVCPDESLRHELVISRMLLALLVLCLLFWTPFSLSNVVYGVCKSCRASMTFTSSLTFKWLAYSSALIGPILSMIISAPLRSAFCNVFACAVCKRNV